MILPVPQVPAASLPRNRSTPGLRLPEADATCESLSHPSRVRAGARCRRLGVTGGASADPNPAWQRVGARVAVVGARIAGDCARHHAWEIDESPLSGESRVLERVGVTHAVSRKRGLARRLGPEAVHSDFSCAGDQWAPSSVQCDRLPADGSIRVSLHSTSRTAFIRWDPIWAPGIGELRGQFLSRATPAASPANWPAAIGTAARPIASGSELRMRRPQRPTPECRYRMDGVVSRSRRVAEALDDREVKGASEWRFLS